MSRVLVACEFSGIVRDAFIADGHWAMSCDLLPSERPGPHWQGDVLALLADERANDRFGFDLLIAHPPCTYLANSGARWLYGGKGSTPDPHRWSAMSEAAGFFRALLDAPIARVAVENPVMHGHGRRLIGSRPSQVVQPFWFGHGETKATALWLRNLPPLSPTAMVEGRSPRVHHASPGPNRWKERSRTLTGIAAAMSSQWGRP